MPNRRGLSGCIRSSPGLNHTNGLMGECVVATEYVLFSRPVNDQTVEHLVSKLHEISRENNDMYLLLNSPGGNVHAGVHCYNMLRAMPTKLSTHNVGHVDSVANALFLGGQERFCSSSSVFMFHGVHFDFPNGARLFGRDFKEHLNSVLADQKRLAETVAANSSIPLEEATELFDVQTVYDAGWAIEKGIVHKVADFQLPSGNMLHQFS